MKSTFIRVLSLILALTFVLSLIPVLHTEAKAVTINQQNIADRADFFFNTTWVCQKNVNAWRDEFVFQKGETYHLPYGQPVNSGKFIGYGVELEEFLMAAADGNSVYYSRQSEFNGWTSVYYATDCAAFVAMCWGTVRQDCSTLPYYSTYKGKPTENNVYNILQLGDALDSTSVGHVVLVSDLIYNANGELIQIEITEQTPPQLKRTYFTPSELAAKYGAEFGIYRYEGSVPAVPELGYTTECTNYAAYGVLEVTADTPIMSLPCPSAIDTESVLLSTALPKEQYTATRLYKNTAGELWYRIQLENDQIGYIAANNTVYQKILLDDISLTDAVYPNAHVRGKTYGLMGNIYARYNQLVTASAYIYQGFGVSSSPKTGSTDYVTGNAYTLKNSAIDYATSFGDLVVGNHTMAISTNYRNYYVKDGAIIENSGTFELAQEYFVVVSSSANQSTCNHNYTQTVISEGNCTQTGLSVFACSGCGKVYKQTDAALGHSFGDWITTEATCTQNGSKIRACTICGKIETNVLNADGHKYSEKVIEGDCQAYPHSIFTCTVCGDSYTVYAEDIMSPWQEVFPSEVDPDLVEVKTQYRYSDLEVILSDKENLEGYTNLGECWKDISSDTLDYVKQWPSGFNPNTELYSKYHKSPVTGSENESDKIILDNDTVTGYLYYHWCYNNSYFSQPTQNGKYNTFHVYYSTTKPDTYRVDTSDMSYCTNHETCTNTDWYFVVEVNTQVYTMQKKMYQQGHWLDYGEWTDTPVQTSDSRQVETRTVYRYPDLSARTHQYEITKIAPSCTEMGMTIYHCSRCNDSYTTDEIAALGHNYDRITVDSSCTEDGSITETCNRCGDTKSQTVPAPGHKYTSLVNAPSCTEKGYTLYTCTCGYSYTADEVESLGHLYDEAVTTDATCTQDGSVTAICSRCNDAHVQTIPATGHRYDTIATAPTCTEKGYTTYTCHCGDRYIGDEKAATGHNYQTVIIDATCTAEGSINAICTNCGDSKVGIIPATGHSYENGSCITCGEREPEEIIKPILTLKSPTLEFKDTICIVAFYTAENTENVVEMGMITYKEKVTEWSIETADFVVPGARYDDATGRYYSSSQGIHAKYLADTVYLACYAKLSDGSYVYTKLAPYSPITYAANQLKNSTNHQLKQLVAAMLNYGSEAQLYFGHNIDHLANHEMTEAHKLLPEIYREDMVQPVASANSEKQGIFANNRGFNSRKPAISFEGAFCINYFFTPTYLPVDGITLYYWNEADFDTADILSTSNATGSFKLDGSEMEQYRGDITGISAKSLSEAVYVAAVYSDGTTTWTSGVLGYSIGTYCSSQAEKGSDVAALAKATAVYGYHAKQYFG